MASEEKSDDFYRKLQQKLRTLLSKDLIIIQGDFKCKDFDFREEKDWLLELTLENNLATLNPCYQQHPQRSCAWISPNGQLRRGSVVSQDNTSSGLCHQSLAALSTPDLKLAKLTEPGSTGAKIDAKEIRKF